MRRPAIPSQYLAGADSIPGLSPVAKLAGRVVMAAVEDARAGDDEARAWLADQAALSLWADGLRVEPGRLSRLAARAMRRR